MPQGPEDIAREQIDRMLMQSGRAVQDAKAVNLYAKQGVAIREFELKSGFGGHWNQIFDVDKCVANEDLTPQLY